LLLIALCFASPAVADKKDEAAAPAALASDAERLLLRLDQRRGEIEEWTALLERFEGDDRRAVELELVEKKLQSLADLHALAANIEQQQDRGVDTAELRANVDPRMKAVPGLIRNELEGAMERASQMRTKREETSPEALLDLEQRIAREDQRVDRIVGLYYDHVQSMTAMQMDSSEEQEWLQGALTRLADFSSGRLELTLDRRADLEDLLDATPDDAARKAELAAVEERLASNVESLRGTVAIMEELEMPTTKEQELLVRATGDIGDILDTEVAAGLVRQLWEQGKTWLMDNSMRLITQAALFFLILFVFRLLAGVAKRVTVRALKSSKVAVSKLLEDMITSMIRRIVMLLGLLVALSQIGISLGPVLAGLGVAGFVIGFALQDTMSNFAAGMMILFYRPFDVDDLVEVGGGVFGKVSRMTLVSTTVLTLDHQTLVVPNSKIWGDVIKNVTAQKKRRVDMTFGISYGDDIPKAENVLAEIVAAHDKVLDEPEPMIKLHNLGESSVDFIVRPWVDTEDYWDVYWDITREVKMRFDAEGISIPFPQRDVHIYKTDETPTEA
jgi:small conductance mechanosensitive channel